MEDSKLHNGACGAIGRSAATGEPSTNSGAPSMDGDVPDMSSNEPRYISAKEAAERLGYVYRYFVAEKLKKGKVPGAYQDQHGKRYWYVPESAVEEYERPTNVTPDVEYVIVSRYRSGEAPMDISRDLSIPKSTIYSAIHRADARRKSERQKPETYRGTKPQTVTVLVQVVGKDYLVNPHHPRPVEIPPGGRARVYYRNEEDSADEDESNNS